METNGELICLSTFEYSLMNSSNMAIHCPECGFKINVRQENLCKFFYY